MTKTDIVIQTIKKDKLEEFLQFSEIIYKNNEVWVEPLLIEEKRFFSKKNPYWNHALCKLFIAKKKNKIVGRLAVFIDKKYTKISKEKVGYFGFFECFNNINIAKELFKEAFKWLKNKKIKTIRGPINGTITRETGFLIHGFSISPEPLMNYNPKYYNTLMRKLNFKKKVDMFAYKINLDKVKFKKPLKNITIRELNKSNMQQEKKKANQIINKAMYGTHQFQFVPYSQKEFDYMAGEMVHLNKDFILFAERDNKPIGVIIVIPNYYPIIKKFHGKLGLWKLLCLLWNLRKIKDAKAEIICVLHHDEHKGVGTYLMDSIIKNLKKRKYKTMEYSWVYDYNIPSIKLAKHYKGELYKKYRLYERKVTKKF